MQDAAALLTGFVIAFVVPQVIPGFMNQFGCPYSKDPKSQEAGTGNPPDGTFKNLKTGEIEKRFNGGNIQDEHVSEDSNDSGTLSMANTGQPNTGGSQIFMNVNDNDGLDWFSEGPSQHVVFGHIVSGMDLCLAVSKVREHTLCARAHTCMHAHSCPRPSWASVCRTLLALALIWPFVSAWGAGQDRRRLPRHAHPCGLGDHLQSVRELRVKTSAVNGVQGVGALTCPHVRLFSRFRNELCESLLPLGSGLGCCETKRHQGSVNKEQGAGFAVKYALVSDSVRDCKLPLK